MTGARSSLRRALALLLALLIACSALSYAARVLEAGAQETMLNLAKSMYVYNRAAEDYFFNLTL